MRQYIRHILLICRHTTYLRPFLCCLAVLCFFSASPAYAACVCGGGDGRFTTVTPGQITIDGSMDDWGAVLADPDNNSCGKENG